MQLWDDILYPHFRATIRGEVYGILSRDDIDEECFNLACRAISTFKFPKIATDYTIFYAKWSELEGTIIEVDQSDPGAVPHAYFNNEITYAEIDVIIAWMKYYWADYQLSNADNYEDIYTDANIKTYSRANAVAQNAKLMQQYRDYAQELETRYSRVNAEKKPSMGDINSDV